MKRSHVTYQEICYAAIYYGVPLGPSCFRHKAKERYREGKKAKTRKYEGKKAKERRQEGEDAKVTSRLRLLVFASSRLRLPFAHALFNHKAR